VKEGEEGKALPFKAPGPLLKANLPHKAPPSMSKHGIKKTYGKIGIPPPPPGKAPAMPPLRGPPPRQPKGSGKGNLGKGKGKSKSKRGAIKIVIPDGVKPGEMFSMEVNGEMAQCRCPPNAKPGGTIWIEAAASPSFAKRKRAREKDTDAEAASWLKQGGGRTRDRVEKAAALAQEYFAPKEEEEQAAKKQKAAAESFAFAKEVMDKAPDNVQTIRSLLQFLEKKLQAEVPAAPEIDGPKDEKARRRVEAYAEKLGRLTALRATSGWDARAKRILDIAAAVKTKPAGAVLEAADKSLEKEKAALEKLLKEDGKPSLDTSAEKRVAWAKDHLKRDWLLWCLRLLHSREAALTQDERRLPNLASR